MAKRTGHLSFRVDDEETQALRRAAGPVPVTDWVRAQALRAAQASGASAASPTVHHVDDLGPDGLRLENGAMKV